METTLPNPATLRQLYKLQLQYSSAYSEMNTIRSMINKIMNKETEISIRITTHDLEQHQINEAEKQNSIPDFGIPPAIFGAFLSGAPAMPMMHPSPADASHIKPCKDSIVFDCNDTSAIRMLNILFLEKQELVTRLFERISALFAEMSDLFANPVLQLNK